MTAGDSEDTPVPRRSVRTRSAILEAARRRFAAQGFERTTIRAVAADAGIDPSLVMRYYGNKARLFDAALDIDLDLPDPSTVPPGALAEAFVRHFLHRWEGGPADDALLLLLRSAVTNERAAQRMRDIFAAQVAPALGAVSADADQVALISTQLLGLALTRHLLRLPAVVGMTPQEIVTAYAPAIHNVIAREAAA
ncbi:TetR family transcriptional regulator [Streptomyces antibioticus]|uniref:TetR/AcrR family transcriptional regulator n=1 Tax=Streptomyces antibioticus TaxID=1890 RepID=UPI0036BB531B